jgi:hypothetical protein
VQTAARTHVSSAQFAHNAGGQTLGEYHKAKEALRAYPLHPVFLR